MVRIETVKISSLVEDPSNARKHSDKNLNAIKGSLAKFGQQKVIVVDKNNVVIAGNGTLAAAKSLGWETLQIARTELTGTEAIAFALADNRSSELAEWDAGILGETLKALQDEDFGLSDIGFDDDDLAKLIPEPEKEFLTDEDEVPENVETRCKPGDLWILGNHRLLCGDSTNVQHVERLMGGEKADMVFTDPPYNIASDSNNYAADLSKAMNDLKNSKWDKNFDIVPALDALMPACADSVTIYVWTSHFLIQKIWDHLKKWCDFTSYCVWQKTNPTPSLSKRHWSWCTELCVYATRGSKRIVNFPKGGNAPNVWSFPKTHHTDFVGHTAQKPIQVCMHPILFSSNRGATILDLFLGSGSTLIACEKTNRKCFGMEIDPHYCDVILERWEKFTGKKATLKSE